VHKLATVASSLFSRVTHWLVIRNGARYILAGTIALAALGAVVSNQGLPKPPTISSIMQNGDYYQGYHGHYGWNGRHRHHHFHGVYFYGHYQPYGGTSPNSPGSGGNAYIQQPGYGFYSQSGSGFYSQSGSGY
jgi:hypothetical protein